MSDEFLGKKVTIVDGPTKSPFFVWHPDILLRLNDFCASPNLFAEGEISGGYVRDMLRDARDEIARLRLTEAEREAIAGAADAYAVRGAADGRESVNAATLRGLLSRTGDCPTADNVAGRDNGQKGHQ